MEMHQPATLRLDANASATRFQCNDRIVEVVANPAIPVLDVLRHNLGFTGTKAGCREGDCGACTVLLGTPGDDRIRYVSAAACLLPLGEAAGRHIVTIEGLNDPLGKVLTPVQDVIVQASATQCGFCTPGIVMSLTGLLLSDSAITDSLAREYLAGNICRCTGYASIRRAACALVERFGGLPTSHRERLRVLVDAGVVPVWFHRAPDLLSALENEPTIALPYPAFRPGSDLPTPSATSSATVGTNAPSAVSRPSRGPSTSGGAVLIAGGTDLMVQQRKRLDDGEVAFSSRFLDPSIRLVPSADGSGSDLVIGGAATMEDLSRSVDFSTFVPEVDRVLSLVASRQIRSRATVAGNIANASPIGDLSIILLALGADLCIAGADGNERVVPLERFHAGYKLVDLAVGELITSIRLPGAHRGALFSFEKICRRAHLDIASVNSAMWARVERGVISEARISAGGVAPVPLYLRDASANLAGVRPCSGILEQVQGKALGEISPISDVRGSREYKSLLLSRIIESHFQAFFGIELVES